MLGRERIFFRHDNAPFAAITAGTDDLGLAIFYSSFLYYATAVDVFMSLPLASFFLKVINEKSPRS